MPPPLAPASQYSFNGQTGDDLGVILARLCNEFPPLAEIRTAALALQAERVKYDDPTAEVDGQGMIDTGRALLISLKPLMDCTPEVLPD